MTNVVNVTSCGEAFLENPVVIRHRTVMISGYWLAIKLIH